MAKRGHGSDLAPIELVPLEPELFDAHGGIALQVCSLAGDVSAASDRIEERWGAPVYLDGWDARSLDAPRKRPVDGFLERTGPGPDLTALYTPGHTLGFHCFVWTR